MSVATTATIVCAAAAAAAANSKSASRNLHPTKYDGWILLGIIVVVVGGTLLCRFWPW